MGSVKMTYFYGILSIFGLLLPYSQFIPWLLQHGLDFKQLVTAIISTRIGFFAWLDVLVVASVLIGFILSEGSRHKIPHLWLPIIATLLVGPSFGLPLFLLFRHLHFEKISAVASLDDHANE